MNKWYLINSYFSNFYQYVSMTMTKSTEDKIMTGVQHFINEKSFQSPVLLFPLACVIKIEKLEPSQYLALNLQSYSPTQALMKQLSKV